MTVRLVYGDDHAMLREEARRWLAERSPLDVVRKETLDGRGDDPARWKELGELGWLGLMLREEVGGAGFAMTHAAVLQEEMGRRLLTSPVLATWLAGWLIERGGDATQRERWLPQIAAGDVIATLAHVEPGGAFSFSDTTAVRSGGVLGGDKRHVVAAATAGLLLVPFHESGGRRGADACRIALVKGGAAGVTVTPAQGLDRTRRSGRVELSGVAVPDEDILEADGAVLFEALWPVACTALAAEMAGGADALLVMTAAYAAERKQFGRAIGSFQALKHPLVDVLVGVEQTRSLVYAAASAIELGSEEAPLLARMAKAKASDTYVFAASRAVQFHGGYGFTEECDAHLYLKRAQVSRPAFGDAAHHRRAIGLAVAETAS